VYEVIFHLAPNLEVQVGETDSALRFVIQPLAARGFPLDVAKHPELK
jgi:hypothetical protein